MSRTREDHGSFWVTASLRLAGLLIIIAAWILAVDVGGLAANQLAPLHTVIARFGDRSFDDQLWVDLFWTVSRWMTGLLPAAVVGGLLGILFGSLRKSYALVELPLEFLRSLPVVAIFPVYLIVWGVLSENSKRAMVFTAAVFPILLGGLYGFRQARPNRREMARVFGAGPWTIFWSVSLPEALPSLWVGFRTALSLSLVVTIVSEFWIGALHGVGVQLFDAYARSNRADMFAYILVLGILGVIANGIGMVVERRLLAWTGR